MINVFIRTVILYLLIVALMRLTGKRQIGQLELTELVTAFMISELASRPIDDNSVPLLYGIIPAITLVCLEVFLSYLSIKSRSFRKLVAGNALALIRKGKLDKNQMNKARITVEELVSAMRCAGVSSLKNIEYAFLEPNGTISVITKAPESPVTARAMEIDVPEAGIEHPVIIDGNIDHAELKRLGIDEKFILNKLRENGYRSDEQIFYMGVDDLLEVNIVSKEENI